MHQAEFERHVGVENICPSINEALSRASEVYGRNQVNSDSAQESLLTGRR